MRLRKSYRIGICVLLAFTGLQPLRTWAQNLVGNPDFQQYTVCPPYLGQIHLAAGWDSPNYATTDFFHACSDSANGNGVPANRMGWQQPLAGAGYAGIRLWLPPGISTPNQREYLAARLREPLEADSLYEISFHASLADFATHTTDALGLGLSVQPAGTDRLLAFTPAVRQTAGALLSDREGWTQIAGLYRAAGGEQHLIIGNFLPDSLMQLVELPPASGGEPVLGVYVYIDAVSVSPVPDCSLAAPLLRADTVLCAGDALLLSTSAPGASHRWSTGDTLAAVTAAAPGVYTVTVRQGGCEWRDTVQLDLAASAPAVRSSFDTLLCAGASWRFEGPAGAKDYRWDDGPSGASRLLDLPGAYQLRSQFPCGTLVQHIRLEYQDCACAWAAENVFSPNGDGVNETLDLELSGSIIQAVWSVFDRWGRCVYSAQQQPFRWDGQGLQGPAAAGWYSWRLHYRCPGPGGETERAAHGSMTLLR